MLGDTGRNCLYTLQITGTVNGNFRAVLATDHGIIGLGSVGTYLLDYLYSSGDPSLEIVAVGRNAEKMESPVALK